MTFSYYPGCTLKTKAKDLNRYAYQSAEALGIELAELPEWQCCGGVYTMAKDEIATKLSSVRALASAQDNTLITLCSACHNVLKQVNNDMKNDEDIAAKANNYLKLDTPYHGETDVLHYLEMLRDKVGFEEVAKKVVNPLKGKKIAAYYGCLLLRPSSVMQLDDPENPTIMENMIRAMGAEPVVYANRNECCGGYVVLESPELAAKKSSAVVENAAAQGADMIITACPLCKYNLEKNGSKIPVVYFTELLAEVLGVKEDTHE